jgi:hypothetical protein
MPTGGKVEYFPAHAPITFTVPSGQTVRGGRIVAANGTSRQCVEAGASAVNPLGYAQYNADGSHVNPMNRVVTVRTAGVWPCVASGAINAGDFVRTGAGGTVVAIAADGDPRLIVGQAIDDIADTAEGPVRLML